MPPPMTAAVRAAEPEPVVRYVAVPEPLPFPGQLKPMPGVSPPDATPPAHRVVSANLAARVEPARAGYFNAIQRYAYAEGALYQVYTAPGQVTDIALEPGETLVGQGPVAAGDTARWIIGDTESGAGAARRVHILVKPTRPDVATNLVINTHRRTYHVELRATPAAYMASVAWTYPADALIALRRSAAAAQSAAPVATGLDLERLDFGYRITGDAPWRPSRAFDDGAQVYIEFPLSIAQGELPPLFVVGPDGRTAELVNYRVRGRHMIVDRLFAAAELRLGGKRQTRANRPRARPVSGARDDWTGEEPAPESDTPRALEADLARELRLRPEPPRVTRLSRKALAITGGAVAIGLGAAFIFALEPRRREAATQELYTTGRAMPAEGVAALPRDYTGIPKLGPPLPGEFGKPVLRQARESGQPIPDGPAVAAIGPSPGGVPRTASPPVDPIAKARRQERAAARTSGLFIGRASPAAAPPSPGVALAAAAPTEAAISVREPVTTAQRRASFVSLADRASPGSPAVNHVLCAGSTIPAALVTGIRSDLPGLVVAQVTEPVRDSATGTTILIPQGARLIGLYDSDLAAGQSRLLMAWTRLLLPDGRAIDLDRMPAADAAGQAGLQDRVDHHWGGMLRAALISTLLGIGGQSGSSGDESDIARALRDGASDSVARTGRQIVERELGRPPTLTIRPGHPVRVIVTRDLVIEPAR